MAYCVQKLIIICAFIFTWSSFAYADPPPYGFCEIDIPKDTQHGYYLSARRERNINEVEEHQIPVGTIIPCGYKHDKDWTPLSYQTSEKFIRQVFARSKPGLTVKKIPTDKVELFLDAPEGTPFTLFNEPGNTYKSCELDCKVGWPRAGPSSKFELKNVRVVEYYDEVRGENRKDVFYQIDGSYIKENGEPTTVTGAWIDSQNVRMKNPNDMDAQPPKPLVLRPKANEPAVCLTESSVGKKNIEDMSVARMSVSDQTVQEYTNALSDKLGKSIGCARDSSNRITKNQIRSHRDPFKNLLASHWNQQPQKQKIWPNKGTEVDRDTLFAIDALARTIYGEMRSCAQNGDHYLMAVARVAVNRATYASSAGKARSMPFAVNSDIELQGQSLNKALPRILGANNGPVYQFTTWHPKDPNISAVMCPVRGKEWNQSLRIAVNAVLFPQDFVEQTKDITHYHYSSGIRRKQMAEVSSLPIVGGVSLARKSCIRFWNDPTTKLTHFASLNKPWLK